MKKLIVCLIFCISIQLNYSQESYTVDGETLQLKTEIEGNLDLLWNTIDGNFRYFVRTSDGTIMELKNTKGSSRRYQQEYKKVLSEVTNGMNTAKLRLTLYSLKEFIDQYNSSVDSSYQSELTKSQVQLRLGFSGGVTNNPFVGNSENKIAPLIGGELELFEANKLPRHSGFIQLRHAFETEKFKYSATEISLGYRFRIINKPKFSVYGQTKLATVNFTNATFTDANNMEAQVSETAFDIPFIFGVGSDIKVGENSFITIIYGELFAVFLDNQGNFSSDISIGYKFNL